MRVNRPNVLAWFSAATGPDPFPLPFPDCRQTPIITYTGEITSVYLNLIAPVPPALADIIVTLKPYRSGSTGIAVTHSMEIDSIAGGQSCLYGPLICPTASPGLYTWEVSWGGNAWGSSVVEVLSEADAKTVSIRAVCSHSRSLQGVRYPWIQGGFSTSFRFRASLIDTPFVVEGTSYREATTGITRPYNVAADRVLKFQLPYSDRQLLSAIEFMLLHDAITLNGQPVTARDHVTATAGRSALAPAQFAVLDNGYANPLIP